LITIRKLYFTGAYSTSRRGDKKIRAIKLKSTQSNTYICNQQRYDRDELLFFLLFIENNVTPTFWRGL